MEIEKTGIGRVSYMEYAARFTALEANLADQKKRLTSSYLVNAWF
jgi:hypothetical protein